MFNHERHSGKLLITCVILFILMLSFLIAFIVEKTKSSSNDTNFTVCRTPECQASGLSLYEAINHAINPCDDFYGYACGNWLEKNPIPDSDGQFGAFASIGYKINEKLKGLLSQPQRSTTDAKDKVKIFYKSCMHEDATVETKAVQEMKELLAKIGGWPLIMPNWNASQWNVWDAIAKVKNTLGIDVIMGTSVTPNVLDTSKYSLFIQMVVPDMIQVGLMSVPHLILNSTAKANPKTAYEQFIKNTVCHFSPATCESETTLSEIGAIVKLEGELQTVGQAYLQKGQITSKGVVLGDTVFHSPNLRADGDDVSNYVMKVRELEKRIENVGWENFIKVIFNDTGIPLNNIGEMEVVALTPYLDPLIRKLNEYRSQPKTIANYIGWKVMLNLMPYASESFRRTKFQYESQIFGLKSEQNASDRCVTLASTVLGFAVANLYASTYMETADLEYAKNLITKIKGGFLQTLNKNSWLDKPTKDEAIVKINKMEENVAFPPWNNDTNLVNQHYQKLGQLSETEFLKNVMSAMKVNFVNAYSKLTQPVDKKNIWPVKNPMMQNAFYYPNLNSFYLLAGIMDLPFISKNSLESLNVGGIGNVIAHEVMHGFDTTGSQFDEMGRVRNWWTPKAMSQFAERAMCMLKQYSETVEEISSLHINGQQTLGENIADNGGLKGSYWGYKASVKDDIRLPGLESISGDKLFFISAAQVWCTNIRKEMAGLLIAVDNHAPAKYRVNIPFANSEEFVGAFNCPKNSKMNPSNKCVIF